MSVPKAKIKPQPLRRKTTVDRTALKNKDEQKNPWKRTLIFASVCLVLLGGFYAVQFAQVANIKASLDGQIKEAEDTNRLDAVQLKGTLEQITANYPNSGNYSSDPVFTAPPFSGRLEARTENIIQGGEDGINDIHANTPMLFITNILMPGVQDSTDQHYRDSLKEHVSNQEFKDFNALKLKVDDLMSGINYCRDTPTDLTYGYTDPIPEPEVKSQRAALIQEAARHHLCPDKP